MMLPGGGLRVMGALDCIRQHLQQVRCVFHSGTTF